MGLRRLNSKTFLLGSIIWVSLLMGCTSTPTVIYVPLPTKETQETTLTETPLTFEEPQKTLEPVLQGSQAESPSLTATILPTKTASATNTVQPTITPTFTPQPANLSLNQDTACFNGASFEHTVSEYFLEGAEFPVLGKVSDDTWWLVQGEGEQTCWLYGEYVSVVGGTLDLPVFTPPPLPTLPPTETPSTVGIYYILISENTGGPFGCGDSLIRYYPRVWSKGDMETDIMAALNALFSNHNQYVNGLSNPMYKSQLKAKGVEVVRNDVEVYLAGNLVRPKDACESKRMHDQVWYTVAQFSPSRAVIYLGNALLGDLLVVAK